MAKTRFAVATAWQATTTTTTTIPTRQITLLSKGAIATTTERHHRQELINMPSLWASYGIRRYDGHHWPARNSPLHSGRINPDNQPTDGDSMNMEERLSSPSSLRQANRISWTALKNKRVLVVGGSGRVGGSVVTQLTRHGASVVVGGTSASSFERARSRWISKGMAAAKAAASRRQSQSPNSTQQAQFVGSLTQVSFVRIDREQVDSVMAVLKPSTASTATIANPFFDLVVHTAGPFQGKVNRPNGVMQACVAAKIPYVDVCDDYCTARAAQTSYTHQAQQRGVPMILSTGCWPGVSSLMAYLLVRHVLRNYPAAAPADVQVDFYFFTAGSGGAGATLLVATFLILMEPALRIDRGRRRGVVPMKDYQPIDFGPAIGCQYVAPLNLLETASLSDVLGVGSVSAQFGTAPAFWNALLSIMANMIQLLQSKDIEVSESAWKALADFSLPIVRLVDLFAGAANAMRCDVRLINDNDNSTIATAIYGHENLEPCVGECVAAFCCALLTSGPARQRSVIPPGIWFPEQAMQQCLDCADDDSEALARSILQLAAVGAHTRRAMATGNLAGTLTSADIWGQ